MRKISLTLVFVMLMAPLSADASVESLLQMREERLLARLLKWDAWCNDQANFKEENRLLLRAAERRCDRVTERLVTLREVTEVIDGAKGTEAPEAQDEYTSVPSVPSDSSSSSPIDINNPNFDLQPNQTFTPVSPLPDLDATSDMLLLGEPNKVVGNIKIRPGDEPVEIRQIKITLTSAISSVASFEVFDEFGYVLGTAAIDLTANPAGNVFTLDLGPKTAYFIEKDIEATIAFRPRTKSNDSGGTGGQELQISRIDITAYGRWTSNTQLVNTTGPDFQKHETALAKITKIENAGQSSGVFTIGTAVRIGTFKFEAERTKDGDPLLETLVFSVSRPTEVSLANIVLQANDSNESTPCSLASSRLTCSSIPAGIGTLQIPRTLSVYADVSQGDGADNTFLQISLNVPGRPGTDGDITWSDGTTSFGWVPFNQPIARGTSWE